MGLGGIVGWGGNNNNSLVFPGGSVPDSNAPDFSAGNQVSVPAGYQPIASSGSSTTQPTVASSAPSGFNIQQFAANPKGYLIGQGLKGVQSLFGGGSKAASSGTNNADAQAAATDASVAEGDDTGSKLSSLFSL